MADDEQRILERFGRLRPPSFSGVGSENAQGFLEKCQRILRTTGILETSGVSFTTFHFSEAGFRWWEAYERHRPFGAVPLTWQEFSILFLEKFMSQSHREELRRQFEQLGERIRRFIDGLTYQLRLLITRERVSGATFDEVVDIARQIEVVRSQ
ncbi:uncharacterized protein [Nicotiana tomentosiformis]|uniref:uncharacterized protein n=1 Tax=Nicotiana tomentosiformis TaxID=4098 RepID=UPI00388C97EF